MSGGWFLVVMALAGCGRIAFDERTGDAGGGSDGASDAASVGFSHLVAYANQTCALFRGGELCWGGNADGQLGDGSFGDALVPKPVLLPAGTIDDFTQGENHGCTIVDGKIYCAGNIQSPNVSTPQPIALVKPAKAIAAGRDFTCVIDAAGAASCWGLNDLGQLGNGGTAAATSPTPIAWNTPPIVSIRAGDDHACVLDASSAASCWGHNDFGTLGTGSGTPASSLTPSAVLTVTALPLIAGWHACTLAAGIVSCWGEGDHGELGDGLGTSTATPRVIPGLGSPTAIATGGGPADGDASCAIIGGAVKCWGNGYYGKLGQGTANPSTTPVDVAGLPGPAASVAIGYDHACALLVDGDVWCWGRGDLGQLGDGNQTNSLVPVKVVAP